MKFKRIKKRWSKEIQALLNKSGVYVIRDRFSKEVLYVGESHTNRLKKTMIRHFQSWNSNSKKSTLKYIKEFLGLDIGAGRTYDLDLVEIAYKVTPKNDAIELENDLIIKLNPRDNENKKEGLGFFEDPF